MWNKLNLPEVDREQLRRYRGRILVCILCLVGAVALSLGLLPKNISLQTLTPAPGNELSNLPSNSDPAPDWIASLVPNFASDYDYPLNPQEPGTTRIPVFAYHHIAEYDPNDTYLGRDYWVTADNFRAQMQYLKDKGYRTINTHEFLQQVKSGANPVQKTVLLTFGDGYADNYSTAFPILKEFGFTATFFIITGRRGITDQQLQEMAAAGMEIQNHTETHSNLALNNSNAFLDTEIKDSRTKLQAALGMNASNSAGGVDALLYPACAYTDYVIHKLVELNYRIAFSCNPTIDHQATDQYWFGRLYVYESLEDFKQKLSGIF